MSEPTPRPNDPLHDAWQAARHLDGDPAPSPGVRARILAQARRGQIRTSDARPHDRDRAHPANDFRWRITAIASVMTLSLAGWLAWQLRYGTPEEPARFETAAAPTAPPTTGERDATRADAREETRARAGVRSRVDEHVAAARAPADAAGVEQPAPAAVHEHRESERRAPASKAAATPPAQTEAAPPTQAAARTPAQPAASSPARTTATPPVRTLAAAAAGGDLDALRRALADGAAIDAADANGQTPLGAAVRARQIAAVRLLLEAGADPNHVDHGGVTPLQHARSGGDVAIADLLVAAGAR